jgi:microsomal dipeptidase-like Zn-dependent dipeptidase
VEKVAGFLRAAGVGHTVFSSDLGQKGNPLPVTAYRRMVRALLDAGTAEDDIRAMVGGNAAQLLFP